MLKQSKMNDLTITQVNQEVQEYLDVHGPFLKIISDSKLGITQQMKDVQTFPDISYVFMRSKIEALLDKYRTADNEDSLAIRVYHGCRMRDPNIDPEEAPDSTIPTLVMVACTVTTDSNGNVTCVENLTTGDQNAKGGGGLEYPKHYGCAVPVDQKFDIRNDNYNATNSTNGCGSYNSQNDTNLINPPDNNNSVNTPTGGSNKIDFIV